MPDFSAAPLLKAAIYARVSSEEQREGQTIDSQIAELERFIRERGWIPAGVYRDEGWSGALLSRPALDRLRDDAARHQFDLVLLNDVDRLARDVSHLGIVKRDLERRGVRVVFRKLPADESPTYNLMVNVLGSFAEFEREMITDRTRRGRRHKVEVRQQFLGAIPAYGYRYLRKDRATGQEGHLTICSSEAALVRQMYEWVDQEALSAHGVVTRLNQLQMRPRKGGCWAKSSVLRILRNETYAGVWYYNKHYGSEPLKRGLRDRYRRSLKSSCRLRSRAEWLAVTLPPELQIVPRDLWERVQQQLTRNTAFSPRNTKHFYLLKGLIRCGGCGAAYVGDPCHGKYYYRCIKRCRRLPTVRESCLDQAVWDSISEAMLKPELILQQVGKFQERALEDEKTSNSESQSVKRALDQARQEETRLLEAYRMGIISPTQLGQELERLKERQSVFEMRASNLGKLPVAQDRQQVRQTLEEYCQSAAERLKTFDDAERQRFLRLLVDNVIFEGRQIRIRAVIPLRDSMHERPASMERVLTEGPVTEGLNTPDKRDQDHYPPNYIANMALHHHGRNTVAADRIADTVTDHNGRNSVSGNYPIKRMFEVESFIDYLSFELCRTLPQKPFSILSDEGLKLVRLLKMKDDDPTLQELCDQVWKERGVKVGLSSMSRALRRLELSPPRRGPRPKELKRAAER